MTYPIHKLRAHCTRISTSGAQTGTLVFHGDRLRFHCDPPILRSDFIPLHSISNVRFDGQQLTIWMPRQIHYQTEQGSLRDIYIAIHKYLNREDSDTLDFDDLLLFGNAHSKKGNNGAIHLTTSSLRFYADNPDNHLDVPLQDIQDVRLRSDILSLSSSVDIVLANQVRSFQGKNANKLYGFLSAIGFGNGPKSIPLFFWECQYRAGLLDWDVLCILTDEALMIVPTNPYFGALSGKGLLIPHTEVSQIDYNPKSASINLMSGDSIQLSSNTGTNRFKKLSETLCSWQTPSLITGSRTQIRHPYLKEKLKELNHQEFLLGACGRLGPNEPVILGWLSIGNNELVFIPRNKSAPLQHYSLGNLCRNDEFDTPSHLLALRSKDSSMAFAMSGGLDFLEVFHERFQLPRRYLIWNEFKNIFKEQKLKMKVVRVIKDNQVYHGVLDLESPFTVILDGQFRSKFISQEKIHFQFDNTDGTYQSMVKVERVGGNSREQQTLIHIVPPKRIAFYNFRSSIRVDLNTFITALRIDSEQKRDIIRGQLRDISESGCGIETKLGLTLQESLLISFPSPNLPLEIVGTIVNIRQSKSSDFFIYGIQFTDDSPRNRRRINQFISQYQAQDQLESEDIFKG